MEEDERRRERILCSIDFSDTSQRALTYAAAIARWYGARLSMLYVFANLPTIDAPPLTLGESERTRLMAQMEKLAAPVSGAHQQILRHAADGKADLYSRLFLPGTDCAAGMTP